MAVQNPRENQRAHQPGRWEQRMAGSPESECNRNANRSAPARYPRPRFTLHRGAPHRSRTTRGEHTPQLLTYQYLAAQHHGPSPPSSRYFVWRELSHPYPSCQRILSPGAKALVRTPNPRSPNPRAVWRSVESRSSPVARRGADRSRVSSAAKYAAYPASGCPLQSARNSPYYYWLRSPTTEPPGANTDGSTLHE